MIFVTVGTQKFQMNRLIKKIDDIAVDYPPETFFIQIGNSDYIPQNVKYERFISKEKFNSIIESASLLITHAGVGSIMSGIQVNKKVIVIPRLKKYGEHVDDHQVDIAEAFDYKKCVIYCKELDDINKILLSIKDYKVEPYVAPKGNIQDIIMNYIG